MKTWNFGIVGAGLIADFHAKAIADIPTARLAGCCDVVAERAEELAARRGGRAFADYEAMVRSDEIDLVTIATPSGLHLEPARAAAEAGKHALCAKPLEVSLERIDAMIEAHARAGTRLGGIHPYRYNDAVAPLREAMRRGRFGALSHAGAYVPWWREDAYYEGSWHGTWKLDGGGAMMNQSIHMIDLLCDLLPPIEALQAFAAKPGHPGIETEDTAVAILRFAGGALGSIYGTTASYPGRLMRLEITGTCGTAVCSEDSLTVWEFDDETDEDRRIRERFSQTHSPGGVADPVAITHDTHTRSFRAFLDALEAGRDFDVDGAEARKAVEVILAIYRSAEEGRLVELPSA